MSQITHHPIGLVEVSTTLDMRFEYDVLGRIVGWCDAMNEGVLPRFVLGRARDGVVWRFHSDLASNLVRDISRLAAREKGFPSDYLSGAHGEKLSEREPVAKAPDRLVMIERILCPGTRSTSEVKHEWVEAEGVRIGELWTLR